MLEFNRSEKLWCIRLECPSPKSKRLKKNLQIPQLYYEIKMIVWTEMDFLGMNGPSLAAQRVALFSHSNIHLTIINNYIK